MIPNSPLPQRFAPFKTWRAVAIGLAIGVATPAFADNLPEVQRLIKKGQYPQALEKVDAYLTSKPKDAQGRFLKGLIYTEMNKPTEAIATFTQLTEDYPELPEPYNNLAVLYAQQKQYDKARTSLEMAIRTHPSYAIAYENLGDVYAKLASQAYDKALQLDSANATTQNKMALIRDLITTSGKGNIKPVAPPDTATTPVASKPVAAPTAPPNTSVVASTPGAAAATSKAPETPAVAQTSSSTPVAATADEVSKAIANWAGAWSRKDIKAYLAQYAADFQTPKGQSRKAWEKERSDRIAGKRGTISVTYDEPNIRIDGNRATAKFRQHYQAPGLSTSTNKTLILVRTGNRWLIQEENTR
ncbi:MAG: tetratricopeptide repeat protein [Rhodocyclaceae bacterium]|nr:tetratricopeptide repeat protein [Rhodocyclaceae bacterium]